MKLDDLKISTRLRLGLGIILILVLFLGGLAYYQAQNLWEDTRGLYEHPLAVRRALGELEAAVLAMQREKRDLYLSAKVEARQGIIRRLEGYEADVYRRLAVLDERYMGPKTDIATVRGLFRQWGPLREESLRLLGAGKAAEALRRLQPDGPEGAHLAKLMQGIRQMGDFSTGRADQFYKNARDHKDQLLRQLGLLLASIFFVSLLISFSLLKAIRGPLKELTAATYRYQQGDLEARSHIPSGNEFGTLAQAFNRLAESVENELLAREKAGRVAEVMLRAGELQTFCHDLLQVLLEETGSQAGAVYLLNRQKTEYEHLASIGLSGAGRAAFPASGFEGEFGAALASKQIRHLVDIPADTRMVFKTVAGDFQPRELITLPILSGKEVPTLLSLVSLHTFGPQAVRLVNDVWNVLTARLNGVLAVQQLREFSEKLDLQNRELEAQKRELTVQADELSEQNLELDMQKRQLEEAGRLKNAFLSNMSHELRTPLNSVIALAGVLRRRLRGVVPEEEFGYLEVIERNGQNLLALINDILDLSRIEAGREEIARHRFSFAELAEEVTAMIGPQAREKNIALVNRVTGELPPLYSDYAKCRHILQNLVGNAVKFTEAGRVEVTAEAVGQELRVTVTDTGIGIPSDQIPFIFDEFRQADDSLSRKYGGSGLGLSIAKKYVALLGGSLTVKSRVGEGSTFTVRLPLAYSPSGPAEAGNSTGPFTRPAPVGPPAAFPVGEGPIILLVEDSEPAVVQLKEMLGEQGYRVRVARNGREALEAIAETLPAGMILDLMMPGVDGFQVLQTIRSREKTARLPVLILTAKTITPEELRLLKGNHIHQLIQKGDISKSELLAAVEHMVLPLKEPPVPTAKFQAPNPSERQPVILVVEDNHDNRITARALLQGLGRVVEAADGIEALEQARKQRPDLILLDISLPGRDGFEILQALRREGPLADVPILALTARVLPGDREEILTRGFDGYIPKPIDDGSFETIIREFLDGSK